MSCYPVVLEIKLKQYYTCKIKLLRIIFEELYHIAAKKYFITLNDEVDKLNINNLTNVPTSLNNVKTTVDDLGNGVMAQWLKRWIPNPGVPCSKPLGGSKVDSAFHSSEVDK